MAVSEVTWPQVVTALVAGAAFVLSIVSLTVQWIMWRFSGARPTVEAIHGQIVVPGHPLRDVLQFTARNAGRAPVQVTALWVKPEDGGSKSLIWTSYMTGSAALPTTLDAGASLIWFVPWESLTEIAEKDGFESVRPGLATGSGRRVGGKKLALNGSGPVKYQRSITRLFRGRR